MKISLISILKYSLTLILIVGALLLAPPLQTQRISDGEKFDQALAAKASNRGLEPCGDASEYYVSLRDKLFSENQPGTYAHIMLIPSFSPPAGVAIHSSSLETSSFTAMPSPEAPTPAISTTVQPIDPFLALRAETVISREIEYPDTMPELGHDGAMYVFLKNRAACGQTWSPQSGRAAELAKLYNAMSGSQDPRRDKSIARIIESIEALELK